MSEPTKPLEGESTQPADPPAPSTTGGDERQPVAPGETGKAAEPPADSAPGGAPAADESGHGEAVDTQQDGAPAEEKAAPQAEPEATTESTEPQTGAAAQESAVGDPPAPVQPAAPVESVAPAAEPTPAAEATPAAGTASAPEAAPAFEATPDAGQSKGEDFAAMLEASDMAEQAQAAKAGDKVSGVVVRLGEEHCFVDFGGRSEGIIATAELKDEKGEVSFTPGDPLEAFVVADGAEIRLSRSIQGQDRGPDVLYQAYKSGVPVRGQVTTANKWGVGVDLNGMRAFCPISQLDTKFIQDAEEYRGKTLEFRILRFRDRGRSIVLSHRALLEEERDKEAGSVRQRIVKGAQLEGKVTRLENFGAFVDVGAGVEGLVHVSELKHERVEHPKEVVEKGAQVKVVVLGVKNLGSRRKERISLSIKALEKDPWDEIRAQFRPGTVTEGKVESIEDYGAFVELAPNVRGMVHVSEMADRRIPHPREVVSVGDQVKVAVMEVDTKRKRLRLSMRRAEQVEDQTNLREFHERQREQSADEPTGGAMQDALKRAQLVD